jgi:undecaprenyl-diphosphatase
MMPWAEILLGIIQGITEFLPVSSSGHLVLFQQWLPVPGDALMFDLTVHMGTLIPVLWFYRDDLVQMIQGPFLGTGPWMQRPGVKLALWVVLASLPTAVIGLAFEDVFHALFARPETLVLSFAITGVLLHIAGLAKPGDRTEVHMTAWHALLIGLVQGLAITPGISRSGSTIAVAMLLGMDRVYAAKFSFLLSVPAIGGAFLLKAREAQLTAEQLPGLGAGFLAAVISGYAALVLLVRLVKSGGFSRFKWYVWLMAGVSAVVALT